jgi:hypothetical protein
MARVACRNQRRRGSRRPSGRHLPRATGTFCVTSWTQRWASFYRPARHYQDHDHRPGSSAPSSSASTATASSDSSRETHAEQFAQRYTTATDQLGHENPLSASVVSTPWLDFVDGWDRPAGIYGRGRPAQRTVAMKWTADMSRATWHSCSKRADPRNRYLASWGKVRCRARARLSTFPTRFRWSRTGTHRYSDLRAAAGARLRCRDERSRLTPARTVTAAQTPANVSNRVP